ncbi:syntaxin-7-like isoform X2 [Gigantopelta aegis]|uniref:syntaxin-7-like isoform X2 n=1 Tax=Gigantopelta aegis TaxID=1735272 RepID=UPI001B88AEC7|nr:syntaxin-7-like isoform X2 [Gigantopelta aegis]XP_041358821.1 syntaxin-7-like isoform X2 [Gigantopelta aegis]
MAAYGRGSFDGFSSYQSSGGYAKTADGGSEHSRLAQTVGNNIQKIQQNVTQIQKLVTQIGTREDSDDIRNRVHQTTHYTNQLAKETNTYLKELAHLQPPSNPSEQRQWKMQKERLTEEFSDALKNFQTTQRTAAEKEKASMARARAHSTVERSPFMDEIPPPPEQDLMGTPGFSQTKAVLQMEQDIDLDGLREREEAIKKLESDIMDVNQIFKDLGMLVHEQGEVLDCIEANIESTQIHVEEGTSQLSKARDYQSKARWKKCCCIIVLIVILIIVAIIITIIVTQTQSSK